jgi:hypothetical protein
MTVVREPGQLASFGAHLAMAAKRASRSVLLVDLSRDALLTRTLRPLGTAPGAISASQLFGASLGGNAVELLHAGVSLVRADARLIDSNLTVIALANRLRRSLAKIGGHDLCIIDADDEVSPESLAAMQISARVVTTTCPVLVHRRAMHVHSEHTVDLAYAATIERQMDPIPLTVSVPMPIPCELDDRDMIKIADRVVLDVLPARGTPPKTRTL